MESKYMTSNFLKEPLKYEWKFICKNYPSKSFDMRIKKHYLSKYNYLEILEKAFYDFTEFENNENFRVDKQLIVTKSKFLFIYFTAKKVSFKINFFFQKEQAAFAVGVQKVDSFLQELSLKYNIEQRQLYFLRNNNYLKKKVMKYKYVDLYVATDHIFINDFKYFVNLDLTVMLNSVLFKFNDLFDNLYLNGKIINKEHTFKQQGIESGLKLTSYIMIDVYLKDKKIKMKNTFLKCQAEILYEKLFPTDNGDFNFEIKNGIYYFRKEDCSNKIKIKSATETTYIDIFDKSSTIQYLKQVIQEKNGIPISLQSLVFKGKSLEDERALDYYEIEKGSILRFFYKLRGGGRSRQEYDEEEEEEKKENFYLESNNQDQQYQQEEQQIERDQQEREQIHPINNSLVELLKKVVSSQLNLSNETDNTFTCDPALSFIAGSEEETLKNNTQDESDQNFRDQLDGVIQNELSPIKKL